MCGDKEYMAKDVHETLLRIIEEEGSMSPDKARDYLETMKQEKRYQRDVY